MKYEIEIPNEYEVSGYDMNKDNTMMCVVLKKKQQKDFNYFIDEYLREDPFTTKDEISNHLFTEDIKEIKTKLRSGDYRWVPWEIKIGLFRFICNEIKVDMTCMTNNLKISADQSHTKLFPMEFIDDLFKTKTN